LTQAPAEAANAWAYARLRGGERLGVREAPLAKPFTDDVHVGVGEEGGADYGEQGDDRRNPEQRLVSTESTQTGHEARVGGANRHGKRINAR